MDRDHSACCFSRSFLLLFSMGYSIHGSIHISHCSKCPCRNPEIVLADKGHENSNIGKFLKTGQYLVTLFSRDNEMWQVSYGQTGGQINCVLCVCEWAGLTQGLSIVRGSPSFTPPVDKIKMTRVTRPRGMPCWYRCLRAVPCGPVPCLPAGKRATAFPYRQLRSQTAYTSALLRVLS